MAAVKTNYLSPSWVAEKDLELSYYFKQSLLFSILPYYDNNPKPHIPVLWYLTLRLY